jgi:hypothetical protein
VLLPVRDSSGDALSPAVAVAIQMDAPDGRRILVANPDKLSLKVELPDETEQSVEEVFAPLRN